MLIGLLACKTTAAPGVTVDLELSPGSTPLLHTARATLSEAAPITLSCSGGSEDLVWDSPDAKEVHNISVAGLLPETEYVCTVTAGQSTQSATFTTGSLPSDLPEITVTGDPAATGFDYLVFNLVWFCEADDNDLPRVVIADNEGRVRWYHDLDTFAPDIVATLSSEGDLLIGGQNNEPRQVDIATGEVVAVSPDSHDHGSFYHHELRELPDGTWLTLADSENRYGGQGSPWEGFEVIIVDPETQEITYRWTSQEAVDAGDLDRPDSGAYHANAVIPVEDELGTSFWVSLLDAKRIVRIDKDTREIDWQLGPDLDFDLTGGDWFDGQHAISYEDGELLLYDNHRNSNEATRVATFSLDQAGRSIEETWEYRLDNFYPAFGDVKRTDDGLMVSSGSHWCNDSIRSNISVLVDDQEVWRLEVPKEYVIYRAEALPASVFTQ